MNFFVRNGIHRKDKSRITMIGIPISKIKVECREVNNNSFKLRLALIKELVVAIEFFDRLHNLQSLKFQEQESKRKK